MIAIIPDIHMWFSLVLIAAAMVGYANDKMPMELTSIFIIATLLTFFHLFPLENSQGDLLLTTEKLLLGFANPALLTVLCLLVLGQAVVQTGALNEVSNYIIHFMGKQPIIALAATLLFVLFVSAILNNTPVVVIFIPIMAALARSMKLSVSKVMIPLSFASILGGMTTLVGSSTNLLVSGVLVELGHEPLGFFDFTVPGLFLAAIGFVYVIFILPKFLPDRASLVKSFGEEYESRHFVAQFEIDYSSEMVGQKITSPTFSKFEDLSIRMVQRGEHAFLPPFDESLILRPQDVIVMSAAKKDLTQFISENSESIERHLAKWNNDLEDEDDDSDFMADTILAEIVVSPSSKIIGKTLEQSNFRQRYNCVVMGIERQSKVIRSKLTEIRLAAGDVLMVMGDRQDIVALHETNDFLLMEWSTEEIHSGSKAIITSLIFGVVVGLAALGILPIVISSFIGVSLILLFGCISLPAAARAIDLKILLMIAASIALGTSLQVTGGAAFVAHMMIEALEGASNLVILSLFFLTMAVLTNVLSNNAAAVIFTPIALNLASELGVNPFAFIFAVVFACNCSFITPIGYQTNLMVMGPGHHKFKDFIWAGIPLAIIIWIGYTIFAHYYYNL